MESNSEELTLIRHCLEKANSIDLNHTNRFHLVSAGIGDNSNLTLRAYQVIRAADIILGMDFIFKSLAPLLVGKAWHHAGHGLFTKLALKSGEVEEVRKEEAKMRHFIRESHQKGKRIVVLDFGDPAFYSPQAGYLKEFADLKPVVVPGISSVNAAGGLLSSSLARSILDGREASSLMVTTLWGLEELVMETPPAIIVLFAMGMHWDTLQYELRRFYPDDTPIVLATETGYLEKENLLWTSVGEIVNKMTGYELTWDYLIYSGPGLKKVES